MPISVPSSPEHFPRRLLLAATGLSPQILTEKPRKGYFSRIKVEVKFKSRSRIKNSGSN